MRAANPGRAVGRAAGFSFLLNSPVAAALSGRIPKELSIETATPNEDDPRVRNPDKSGLLVDSREISTNDGVNGGRTRTRTLDPLIKSQLLYQLSYAP